LVASSIDADCAGLPADLRGALERHHFDLGRLRGQAARLAGGTHADNRVRGRVEPPGPNDIDELPARDTPEHTRLAELGQRALSHAECALVVLAGGMATRMGGAVKALVEALPGRTFLELRLDEIAAVERSFGRAPPLWLMVSAVTEAPIRAALGSRLDGRRVAVFPQHLSLRLTPDGRLFRDAAGQLSTYAPGHGDLVEALRDSGLLGDFLAQGGRTLMMTNLDNLGGRLDPPILGFHLAHGQPVTSEVTDKLAADRGGIPVRVDGRLCVLEEFRLPETFDASSVPVFNTNVFHFDARALVERDLPFSFFEVEKSVGGRRAVQFERLINEVTSALPTRYLRVPRSGAGGRFLPVKDVNELARRRHEIEEVVQGRASAQQRKPTE
jgi:UTP--glucose-1-phosphate uridylyltransferase